MAGRSRRQKKTVNYNEEELIGELVQANEAAQDDMMDISDDDEEYEDDTKKAKAQKKKKKSQPTPVVCQLPDEIVVEGSVHKVLRPYVPAEELGEEGETNLHWSLVEFQFNKEGLDELRKYGAKGLKKGFTMELFVRLPSFAHHRTYRFKVWKEKHLMRDPFPIEIKMGSDSMPVTGPENIDKTMISNALKAKFPDLKPQTQKDLFKLFPVPPKKGEPKKTNTTNPDFLDERVFMTLPMRRHGMYLRKDALHFAFASDEFLKLRYAFEAKFFVGMLQDTLKKLWAEVTKRPYIICVRAEMAKYGIPQNVLDSVMCEWSVKRRIDIMCVFADIAVKNPLMRPAVKKKWREMALYDCTVNGYLRFGDTAAVVPVDMEDKVKKALVDVLAINDVIPFKKYEKTNSGFVLNDRLLYAPKEVIQSEGAFVQRIMKAITNEEAVRNLQKAFPKQLPFEAVQYDAEDVRTAMRIFLLPFCLWNLPSALYTDTLWTVFDLMMKAIQARNHGAIAFVLPSRFDALFIWLRKRLRSSYPNLDLSSRPTGMRGWYLLSHDNTPLSQDDAALRKERLGECRWVVFLSCHSVPLQTMASFLELLDTQQVAFVGDAMMAPRSDNDWFTSLATRRDIAMFTCGREIGDARTVVDRMTSKLAKVTKPSDRVSMDTSKKETSKRKAPVFKVLEDDQRKKKRTETATKTRKLLSLESLLGDLAPKKQKVPDLVDRDDNDEWDTTFSFHNRLKVPRRADPKVKLSINHGNVMASSGFSQHLAALVNVGASLSLSLSKSATRTAERSAALQEQRNSRSAVFSPGFEQDLPMNDIGQIEDALVVIANTPRGNDGSVLFAKRSDSVFDMVFKTMREQASHKNNHCLWSVLTCSSDDHRKLTAMAGKNEVHKGDTISFKTRKSPFRLPGCVKELTVSRHTVTLSSKTISSVQSAPSETPKHPTSVNVKKKPEFAYKSTIDAGVVTYDPQNWSQERHVPRFNLRTDLDTVLRYSTPSDHEGRAYVSGCGGAHLNTDDDDCNNWKSLVVCRTTDIDHHTPDINQFDVTFLVVPTDGKGSAQDLWTALSVTRGTVVIIANSWKDIAVMGASPQWSFCNTVFRHTLGSELAKQRENTKKVYSKYRQSREHSSYDSFDHDYDYDDAMGGDGGAFDGDGFHDDDDNDW